MEYKLELLSYLLILKKKYEKISKFDEKIKTCINTFEKNVIEEKDLIHLFNQNVLDISPSIRSVCWKIALKHLSLNTKKWNTELGDKRKLYEQYLKSFITVPSNPNELSSLESKIGIQGDKQNGPNNKTKNRNEEEDTDWINSELFNQINKDTFRTRSELSFFNLNPNYTIRNNIQILNSLIDTDIDYFLEEQRKGKESESLEERERIPSLVDLNSTAEEQELGIKGIRKDIQTDKKQKENTNTIELESKGNSYKHDKNQKYTLQKNINDHYKRQCDSTNVCDIINPKRHYDQLCRILFIYAKIHPYIKYVQGMNEILAPLYFIIFNDPLCNNSLQGEADTFFCFTELMQRQKDVFCEGLDNTDEGINGKLEKFSLLLKLKEYEIWNKLYQLKIETQYYALKWILLLLNQEFDMADTIIFYDHFISSNDENLILYVCLVILQKLKQPLLCGNFSINLKLLQNIPPFDPYDIIYEAKQIMKADQKYNFNISEFYTEYVNERRKKQVSNKLKLDEYVQNYNIKESEYGKNIEGDKKNVQALLNHLKNKPIVQNIKNYINNKMEEINKLDDILDLD